MDSSSPTFKISLPAAPLSPLQVKATSEVLARSPSIHQGGKLSPMPLADSVPATSKSTEVQNRMIDEQLEMLGELFPEQMKKYSQTIDSQALETMMSSMHDAPPVPTVRTPPLVAEQEADTSSDFQKTPVSSSMPLSSDWPKLPDVADSDESAGHSSAPSEIVSPEPAAKTPEAIPAPASPEKPLTERRSLVPKLRVDTVNSQQYATKELQLIRRMKEQNRLKAEVKVRNRGFFFEDSRILTQRLS